MKTLNVKKTNIHELEKHWGFKPPVMDPVLYIRCNVKGSVNWEKSPVYTYQELLERGNYIIH